MQFRFVRYPTSVVLWAWFNLTLGKLLEEPLFMVTATVAAPIPDSGGSAGTHCGSVTSGCCLMASTISAFGDQFYFVGNAMARSAANWVCHQDGSHHDDGSNYPALCSCSWAGRVSDRSSPRKIMMRTAWVRANFGPPAAWSSDLAHLSCTRATGTRWLPASGRRWHSTAPRGGRFHPVSCRTGTTRGCPESVSQVRTMLATIVGPGRPAGIRDQKRFGLPSGFFIDCCQFSWFIPFVAFALGFPTRAPSLTRRNQCFQSIFGRP